MLQAVVADHVRLHPRDHAGVPLARGEPVQDRLDRPVPVTQTVGVLGR